MKKLFLLSLWLVSFFGFAQEDYMKKAAENLERGNRLGSIEMATKAIEQNQKNHEARWIRIRALLSGDPREEQLSDAITDINVMIDDGIKTAKVYKMLGKAQTEKAYFIYRWKKAKENTGFSDDNSTYIKEQASYYNEAINHYKLAIEAYRKASEVSPEELETVTYKIKDIEQDIQTVQQKIKQLK